MMYIEYRVYCDGAECDANVPSDHGGAVSSTEALNQARIGGWYISGKRHICKGCLDDMTDEDREKLMKNKRRRKASAKLAKGKLNVINELVRVPDGPNGKRISLVAAEIYTRGVDHIHQSRRNRHPASCLEGRPQRRGSREPYARHSRLQQCRNGRSK